MTVPNLDLNLGTLGAMVYIGFYLLLEPVAGAAITPIILGWTAYARHFTSQQALSSAFNKNAVAIHIVCWLVQFIGHGVYEGRSPALMDNLVQALFLAPFFVFMEVLFKFGYRPELKRRVDLEVAAELKKLEAAKAKKKM